MPVDINTLVNDLNDLLEGIYNLERSLYEIFLSDTPQSVPITYKDLDRNPVTVNIDNIAKLKENFSNLEVDIFNKCSFINLLQGSDLTSTASFEIINSAGVTYSVQSLDLTTDDKVAISTIIGYDIFTPPNALQGIYKKLVFNLSTTSNRGDFRFGQNASVIGLSVYHPKSFRQHAFINPNGTGWTTDLTGFEPDIKTNNHLFQLQFGDMFVFEIFYPVLYPIYNRGLVVSK